MAAAAAVTAANFKNARRSMCLLLMAVLLWWFTPTLSWQMGRCSLREILRADGRFEAERSRCLLFVSTEFCWCYCRVDSKIPFGVGVTMTGIDLKVRQLMHRSSIPSVSPSRPRTPIQPLPDFMSFCSSPRKQIFHAATEPYPVQRRLAYSSAVDARPQTVRLQTGVERHLQQVQRRDAALFPLTNR